MDDLVNIAQSLVAPNKGILAADESLATIEKRFKAINLESTPENRKAYRELLFSTPGLEEFISGVIMFDETFRNGLLKNLNIIAGIKVDEGLEIFNNNPNEKVTKGITSLESRLDDYKNLGAKFTKWRAAFTIGPDFPSIQCVEKNAELLAEFASLSQKYDLVPIVEPEILMDGAHSIDRCKDMTRGILKVVFIKLQKKNVNLHAMLLKSNMILPGKDYGDKSTPETIAQRTLEVLTECVPPEVPGIVFLSGGQTPDEATTNLREINKLGGPWQLSFSFGRALQDEALKSWNGKVENIQIAQQKFIERARMVSSARHGK